MPIMGHTCTAFNLELCLRYNSKMSYYTRKTPTSADQNASTNLDQDLHLSRDAKYKNSEKEVVEWIFNTLNTSQDERVQYQRYDLIEILKDGYILCQLGNLLGIANCPTKKYKSSKMPFVQMENILFFLKACEMVGVAHDEIFQTVDLFDRKDPYQVIVTLMSFSRRAKETNAAVFTEVIGPKVVKVKPPVPRKPIGLRR